MAERLYHQGMEDMVQRLCRAAVYPCQLGLFPITRADRCRSNALKPLIKGMVLEDLPKHPAIFLTDMIPSAIGLGPGPIPVVG